MFISETTAVNAFADILTRVRFLTSEAFKFRVTSDTELVCSMEMVTKRLAGALKYPAIGPTILVHLSELCVMPLMWHQNLTRLAPTPLPMSVRKSSIALVS